MEWVVTTGKTVEEAKERALDQLGVDVTDAEFEVLEEPKAGLFGRLKGEAKVRARVRPAPVRQKMDRRDRRGKGGERADDKGRGGDRKPKQRQQGDQQKGQQGNKQGAQQNGQQKADDAAEQGEGGGNTPKKREGGGRQQGRKQSAGAKAPRTTNDQEAVKENDMDAHTVGLEAQRFLEGLVSAFGLSGTVELAEDGDELELRVQGDELGLLVGPRGTTLQALQDVVRVASQRRLGDHDTRLRVDVGGYRERRRVALGQFATKMADEVRSSGVARVLEPMSSADRKIVHDTLAGCEGIVTRSEGEDPQRRVIIAPAND